MYDLRNLSISDIIRSGIAIRSLGHNAASMEEAATAVVKYFYDNVIDGKTGKRALVQVRLFKTHDFDKLPKYLQQFAEKMLDEKPESTSFKCLTLLGTIGAKKEWCNRRQSKGHQAIPLPSKEVLNRIPMMRNLVKQMGLDVETVINPDPNLLTDLSQKTFNAFSVPEALGSPYIPAQKDFVKSYRVKSCTGFGGILPSGNVFTVIIFSNIHVSKDIATLLNTLALNIKMLIMPFESKVFSN